jgi:O-antigen/teichoic acid export membrane protein
VAQSVGLVAYTSVAAEHAEGDSRHLLREILKFVALTLVLCGGIVIATELLLPYVLPPLFGHAFASAVGVARILLVSSLLFCLTRVLSDCARGLNRPGLGTVAEIVSLLMLFPFVAILSGRGAKGVAGALALAAGCGVFVMVLGLTMPERVTRLLGRLWPFRRTGGEAMIEVLDESDIAEASEPSSAIVTGLWDA